MSEIKFMTKDELQAEYRVKKANSRKDCAPLFIYRIITTESNKNHPLTQADIIKKLEEYPYEIKMERKAISRICHGLEDTGLGIVCTKNGTWFDEEEVLIA